MSESKLSKSLYQAVMKTLSSAEGKKHAVKHIVRDLDDPNMKAQVPQDHIPAASQGVLHKDVSISEAHQMKQANAEAKMGLRPGEKASGMMGKTIGGSLAQSEEAPSRGIDKLKKFMEKCEMKKAKSDISGYSPEIKGVHNVIGPDKESRMKGSGAGSWGPGESVAGANVRRKDDIGTAHAKQAHQSKLDELKAMPKPNLPKSEDAPEDENFEAESDTFEPDLEDIFFSPTGQLGAQTAVSAGGKHLGVFNSDDEAHEAARQWAHSKGFWPNAWHVSDHGNYHLIENFHGSDDMMNKMLEPMPALPPAGNGNKKPPMPKKPQPKPFEKKEKKGILKRK